MPPTLCDAALDVLNTAPAQEKCAKTRAYYAQWCAGEITEIGVTDQTPDRPARPVRPELRHASQMPKRRKAGTTASKIALLHALSHIELNAVDLAWDIIARFSHFSAQNADGSTFLKSVDAHAQTPTDHDFTLPRAFFDAWAKVADDEAKHHMMLEDRMSDLGATYGDLPAHDGLWDASMKTAHDFPARLAIVPMVLEARGLDVTPGMIAMMKSQEDEKTAAILQTIHDDEITHVEAGTTWFKAWCAHHGHDVETYWQDLVKRYFNGRLKRPFNHPSREEAGMIRDWYEPLADLELADPNAQ